MGLVAESGKTCSVELVEINPILDIQSATAKLDVELALSALGQTILSGLGKCAHQSDINHVATWTHITIWEKLCT